MSESQLIQVERSLVLLCQGWPNHWINLAWSFIRTLELVWNNHVRISRQAHKFKYPTAVTFKLTMFANWLLLFIYLGAIQGNVSAFKPLNYAKSAARCIATRREPVRENVLIELGTLLWALSSISTPNHYLEYVEINPDAPNTLLMVHGWPSLWSSWSNQIEEFQVRCPLSKSSLNKFTICFHS